MFRFRRKDGESQMVFNQRSAKKILEWFQHSKVRMAHHRVLKAIFLASWHEKRPAIGLRQHCLQLARECRTRAWWESLQASSTQSGRKAEGLVRARAGHPTTAWEDVFVQVFGAHWRAERDSCASRRDWMCHCDDFINQVCDFWNLPKLPHSNRHCAFHDTGRAANSECWDDIPILPDHPLDQKFLSSRGRLWIQVDCKGIADLTSGRAVLQAEELHPAFIRISRDLLRLHSMGWKPMHDGLEFVLWAPRKYNPIADHGCNVSMDHQKDFRTKNAASLQDALEQRYNLRLCVDGGLRASGEAAFAFALFSAVLGEDGAYAYTLLWREAVLLGGVRSSFTAEAVALETSLAAITEEMSG